MNDEQYRALTYGLSRTIPRSDFGGTIQFINWLILYNFCKRQRAENNNDDFIIIKNTFTVTGRNNTKFESGSKYSYDLIKRLLDNA